MTILNATQIDVYSLTIDPRAQRTLNTKRVEIMAGQFNAAALGTITVSQRADGTRIILDGQHRIAAAKLAGYKGYFNAIIHTGLTLQQEAALFLELNNTKEVSALDKFLVRITAGDIVANEINHILIGYGWKIGPSSHRGYFVSVAAIERVHLSGGTNGGFLVDGVIKTITDAWGHESTGTNGSIVGGLGLLFNKYGHDLSRDKLVREMQGYTPRVLLAKGRAYQDSVGGSLPSATGYILHSIYNRNLRKNTLPEWK